MDTREEILARLQHWVFEEQRWTKAEFARRTGIAPQNVNKYLSGELNIE
ncbi:MAG: helix-turn-helix transcriptional regulator, partial [Candidatus Kapabacteria bacterium]|nr:helix-turn-helix transcriptional regulator [Candidatus Kapabacteria bacterium]